MPREEDSICKYADPVRAAPHARVRRLADHLAERAARRPLAPEETELLRDARRTAAWGGWTPGTDAAAVGLGTAVGALWGVASGGAIACVALLCLAACSGDGADPGGALDCGPCGDPCCCAVLADGGGVSGSRVDSCFTCCPNWVPERPEAPAGRWDEPARRPSEWALPERLVAVGRASDGV